MSVGPYRYRFGRAEFDGARLELRIADAPASVQAKPLELLALLLATPGETVSKRRIFETVWKDREVVDAVLANAVAKLRTALGPAHAGRLVTVPRLGYRFEGPVERFAVGRGRAPAPDGPVAGRPVPGRSGHRLLRRLGAGAGGRRETWLAEQPRSGDRRVFKFATDGEGLAALQREWTIARVLHAALGERDDIVRLLDANFDEAPFWLESAWGGEDLDAWAAGRDGPAPGGPMRLAALPVGERLALAGRIADALAAAHGAGVLHTDLKPGNVLIAETPGGGTPRIRLVDFGSAQLLDAMQLERLRVTRLGLTLAAHDTASGTPYYIAPERLAGADASPAADVFALGVMVFQLAVGDLRRVLAPGWERDVDDPLLRADIALATDVDPARRLASAAELAARLRTLPERHATHRAEAARAALERQQAALAALERRNAAALALNRLLREDLIGAANPAASGRTDVTVAEAVSRAAALIDTKYAALPDAIRGGLHAAMQASLSELSRAQEAVTAGRRAVAALTAAAAASHGTTDEREDLVAALQEARLRLAFDLLQLSALDEAGRVLADAEADAGPPASQPPLLRARLLFVRSWVTAGRFDFEASLAELQEAFALVEPMTDAEAPLRDKVMFALADGLRLVGRLGEAEALYRRLLHEQEQRLGADHARPLYTRVGLGSVLVRLGRHDDAQATLQTAADGLAAAMGPGHRQTLTALDMLAELHFARGAFGRAADTWAEVQAGYAALMGAGSSYVITVQTQRAQALHGAGRAAEAAPMLRDALERLGAIGARDAPQAQQVRFALADCLLDLGAAAEAATLVPGLEAEALASAQPAPDWPARLAALRRRLDGAAAAR